MQPTGNLHIGNYLGALKTWSQMQYDYEPIFCIVDHHAITVYQEPKELQKKIEDVAALYVAAGIDPKHASVFVQSTVPAHVELAWVFTCVTPFGWLNRMTQFKAKTAKAGNAESFGTGLFCYPTLMAADILTYHATHVPVGEDQKQHLELSRDIAQKFNNDFADSIANCGFKPEFFPLPEPLITGPVPRVMSLRDGTKKMSSSDISDMSRINLTDTADLIAQKIRKAKTDLDPLPSDEHGLEGRPEATNLIDIYAGLSGQSREAVLNEFGGSQFSQFKSFLSDLLVDKISPIGEEMRRLIEDPAEIDRILSHGADRARGIAAPIIADTKQIMGFIGS